MESGAAKENFTSLHFTQSRVARPSRPYRAHLRTSRSVRRKSSIRYLTKRAPGFADGGPAAPARRCNAWVTRTKLLDALGPAALREEGLAGVAQQAGRDALRTPKP